VTSDSDHPNQFLQPIEVGGVAGVEVEVMSVSGRGDQQVGEPGPGMRAFAQRGRCHEAITACGRSIERDRLELRLDLLKPCLSPGRLHRIPGQQRPGGQLGGSDGRDRPSSGNAARTAGSYQSITTEVSSRPGPVTA